MSDRPTPKPYLQNTQNAFNANLKESGIKATIVIVQIDHLYHAYVLGQDPATASHGSSPDEALGSLIRENYELSGEMPVTIQNILRRYSDSLGDLPLTILHVPS